MDLTPVLVERDSLETDLIAKTSTSVRRMEARVTKTRSVSTTLDRTLVFAKMASREMAQFVLILMSVLRVHAMQMLIVLTPMGLTFVLARGDSEGMDSPVQMSMNVKC